jgi:hypothetical protein
MVQTVGFDPFLTSFASADLRRPPESQPDSSRVTPLTENEASSADSRRSDPSETRTAAPALTRVAFTAKFGPDPDGFPLQLVRGEQVEQAQNIDAQAIAENRIAREESRAALLQAQEARDARAADSQRRQDANEARRADAAAERRSDQDATARQADDAAKPSGSVLDLQV